MVPASASTLVTVGGAPLPRMTSGFGTASPKRQLPQVAARSFFVAFVIIIDLAHVMKPDGVHQIAVLHPRVQKILARHAWDRESLHAFVFLDGSAGRMLASLRHVLPSCVSLTVEIRSPAVGEDAGREADGLERRITRDGDQCRLEHRPRSLTRTPEHIRRRTRWPTGRSPLRPGRARRSARATSSEHPISPCD